MKKHKYNSKEEAIADLKTKGEVKFWGRIGHDAQVSLYSLTTLYGKKTVYVYMDGTVEYSEW